VPQTGPWQAERNDLYLMQRGEIHLLVEKIGTKFRVLVTRSGDEMQPDEIFYSGTAESRDHAMAMAEQEAERVSAQIPVRILAP